MSRRKKKSSGTMLDLWRPPPGAGDPLGCLATTYTFKPALFDEQCLGRFLEIESEPDREDLAFLLERENRLGSIYAGVLVDHTQAGVEHSLRWDVLPVRIRAGKQHAKVSLLVWTHHVRIIVTSANLTEQGYRLNHEVAAVLEFSSDETEHDLLEQSLSFLRNLLLFVPAALERPPEVDRVESFLGLVERHVSRWKPSRRQGQLRQQLVFTLPSIGGHPPRSSLYEAIRACRKRGASPDEAWIASPFFDPEDETSRVAAQLCKAMARKGARSLHICVPQMGSDDDRAVPRLAAPKALIVTPPAYRGEVCVWGLPSQDEDGNSRPWHAKMLGLSAQQYTAVMIGSSNFTGAGMGVAPQRNAEANLIVIADRVSYGREARQIQSIWPDMDQIAAPETAEWLGAHEDWEEEELATAQPLPEGFLSATYRAGDARQISLRLDEKRLPENWEIATRGSDEGELLSSEAWRQEGRPRVINVAWAPVQPPEKLLVCWEDQQAFLPLNVENSGALPPPVRLQEMSAEDMLLILAAADPSAAFRAWARRRKESDLFDEELDSATPPDLDPLGRYDLHATFLHRIRRRARSLARVRENVQRAVWGRQALEWRLRGMIGVEALAERLVRELPGCCGSADEGLLTLADLLIVLREVDYQPTDGALSKPEFEAVFRPFVAELAADLRRRVNAQGAQFSEDVREFWERVLMQCQA